MRFIRGKIAKLSGRGDQVSEQLELRFEKLAEDARRKKVRRRLA